MKGLKRNLRYWLGNLEVQALTMTAVMLVMVVVMAFLEGENVIEIFWSRLSAYLILVMFIFTFSHAFSCMTNYFPLTISLGSDRKSSFIAMQLSQHLVMLELLTICLLSMNYAWDGVIRESIALVITVGVAVLFFLQGFGTIISMVTLKFGRNVGTAVYISVLVITMLAIGITAGFLAAGVEAQDFSWQDILENVKLWLPVAAILFDAAMVVMQYRCMRKCDLQFA